jgi:KTSC domain-containing protein
VIEPYAVSMQVTLMKRGLLILRLFGLLLPLLFEFATASEAETVDVKYRGLIPLDRFTCSSIERSSFIRRVCYDRSDVYMVIRLNDTYYHYCDIDKATADAFLNAESMGQFFNSSIKGHFDCRTGHIPNLQ